MDVGVGSGGRGWRCLQRNLGRVPWLNQGIQRLNHVNRVVNCLGLDESGAHDRCDEKEQPDQVGHGAIEVKVTPG